MRKIAAAVTSALMLLTACQSSEAARNADTEEESVGTGGSYSEAETGAGGIIDIVNDILNINTSSALPEPTNEPVLTSEEETEQATDEGSVEIEVPATTESSASTTAEPELTDDNSKVFDTALYQPSGNAGTVSYFGFYDITADSRGIEQCEIFQSDLFGGDIQYISALYNNYFDKLSVYISADDPPDLVTKDAMLYPGNVSKSLFEPLDGVIDIESALWSDMKPVADLYSWNGNHYYYPHCISTSFALNYIKKTIVENDLPDPYTLYKNGEWTWVSWRDIMTEFCDKNEKNIGFYATDAGIDAFILTTGTPLIDSQPSGTIRNNIQSANVNRAMQFIQDLQRRGLFYDRQYGDWVTPMSFAEKCGNLLFTCMEPEWNYSAATEYLQNSTGVENDIFDTVSEFEFVPMPRDTRSDAYYQGFETFGYLIPKGARNISGAVEFINLNRAYEADPVIQEQVKNDHIHPEKIYCDTGKNAGYQKWQMIWGEQEYDLWREMKDPAKFSFVVEDAYGFSLDIQSQVSLIEYDVGENGDSWEQRASEMSAYFDEVISSYS